MKTLLWVVGLTLLLSSSIMADGSKIYEAAPVTYIDGYAEINHFYDNTHDFVFDQILIWEWNPDKSRHEVRAWALLKKSREPYSASLGSVRLLTSERGRR